MEASAKINAERYNQQFSWRNLHSVSTVFTSHSQSLLHTVAVNTEPVSRISSSSAFAAKSLWSTPAFASPIVPVGFPAEIPVSQPRIHAEIGRYRLRLAESVEDRDAACRLRFKVFNIELGKGLESSYETGLDTDHFDLFCEHLLVEDKAERKIVGTYRLQTGITAALNLGYYSEQEFDFSPYESMRPEILELGRASIDREHRTPEVLTLLWRGIAQYANDMQLRYLIGCSSLNSTDPREGWHIYRQSESSHAAIEMQTTPMAGFECPGEQLEPTLEPTPEYGKVPKLLRTYLAIGARICSAPAWDREFGTIDFLTLLDLRNISASARKRFLAPLAG
jgi:putative hemolysin